MADESFHREVKNIKSKDVQKNIDDFIIFAGSNSIELIDFRGRV